MRASQAKTQKPAKLHKTSAGSCDIYKRMSEAEKQPENDEALAAIFAKTRKSLIARLDNWEDQQTWDEFYKT